MLLRVEKVNTYYGAIRALKDVSLDVQEGEIVTLIGANGAGKSTLLKTISGLLKPSRGEILFQGIRIDSQPAFKVSRMGIAHVPEGRRVFPGLTVKENLMMGAYPRKDNQGIKESLEKALALFPRLRERFSQKAGTLSGGEQQMLAIARGMLLNPKIILLDEPSLGLAPIVVQQVFATIKEINKDGTTVLLVEQNAFLALQIATRGYVLETGEVILHDTTKNLKNNDLVKKSYLGED
jgi:branched-chain amino acid transport system ATP-binding protein